MKDVAVFKTKPKPSQSEQLKSASNIKCTHINLTKSSIQKTYANNLQQKTNFKNSGDFEINVRRSKSMHLTLNAHKIPLVMLQMSSYHYAFS